MWWNDQKYDVFKIAKRMLKNNQDNIGEQCIRNDDDVLAISDEDKKIALKSYHGKLLNTEFTLSHCQNVAGLSPFYYYCGRCSSELVQLVPLPYSRGRSTCYSDRLYRLHVTIPRCFKDIYVNSFFLGQLDSGILCLWNGFL